jgi:hypothetical protein
VRIEADSVIPFPRDVVFRAYRDDLTKVVEFLPNVRAIEIVSRKDEGATTTLHNVWHGGGDVPAALRAFVDDKLLAWDDFAVWNEAEHGCEWTIRTHAFTEAVSCMGRTRMIPVGEGKTRVELAGDFAIDGKKLKGIPSLVAGSVGRAVEGFLAKQITANLGSTTEGLSRYLAKKQSA